MDTTKQARVHSSCFSSFASPSPSPGAAGAAPSPATILARDLANSSSCILSISSSVIPFPAAFFAFLAFSPCDREPRRSEAGEEGRNGSWTCLLHFLVVRQNVLDAGNKFLKTEGLYSKLVSAE